MSFKAMRLALMSEAAALDGSHHALVQMEEGGAPADPVDALARATKLRGVLLMLDRCSASRAIQDELKRIARAIEQPPDDDDKRPVRIIND